MKMQFIKASDIKEITEAIPPGTAVADCIIKVHEIIHIWAESNNYTIHYVTSFTQGYLSRYTNELIAFTKNEPGQPE